MKTFVKEIFSSVQGEGPYVGYKQLFIRFCGCNLNCNYCDTNHNIEGAKEYTANELSEICRENLDCHSVSLTGGEPLLNIDFLKEFVPKSPLPVYLETNGTLYENLKQIIDNITYVAADIKLSSCAGVDELWEIHNKFFSVAGKKILFAKAVFDEKITDEEINNLVGLCVKYEAELILQPKTVNDKPSVSSDFVLNVLNKCLKQYKKVRVIPQVHKFLNVE